MIVEIDTMVLAAIIYNKFIGDCECRTACYKFCVNNGCFDSIHKALIEEIAKIQNDKNNTLQK